MGPRFPASFGDVIAVGALDKAGNPTQYSNYPGDDGVSTYGGNIPSPIAGNPKSPAPGCLTRANVTDAIIGVYTALSYPALSATDCEPNYPIPNANAWAYWSGTSFATPIISGLAARILQYRLENPASSFAPPTMSIPQALMNAGATRQITWDRLETGIKSEPGRMILAVQQCASRDRDDDDEKRERVEVHVTVKE